MLKIDEPAVYESPAPAPISCASDFWIPAPLALGVWVMSVSWALPTLTDTMTLPRLINSAVRKCLSIAASHQLCTARERSVRADFLRRDSMCMSHPPCDWNASAARKADADAPNAPRHSRSGSSAAPTVNSSAGL